MRFCAAYAPLMVASVLMSFALAQSQPAAVIAEVLTPSVEVQPREVINLRVRFSNTGRAPQTIMPSVTVPRGWVVLVPPSDVSLAPGDSRVTLFTVLAAPDATPQTYTFVLTYHTSGDGSGGEALFTVRVPAVDLVELLVVEAPALVPAGPHTVRFLLRNQGNTAHEWGLTASSSLGLGVAFTPAVVVLAPGESAEITARVAAPEGLARQRTHILTLTATSRALAELRARARASVVLIPSELAAASALHTFPLTLRVAYGGGAGAPTKVTAGAALEVKGGGALSDQDPGRLSVDLRVSQARLVERFSLEYRQPSWGVQLGDQAFSPSPLSSGVRAFGVSSSAAWQLTPQVRLAGDMSAYLVDGAGAFGVAATAALPHGTRLGVTLSSTRGDLLGTFRVRYAPEARDPTRLELAALEAIYGVRAGGDVQLAHAFRLSAQVNDGPSFARFAYDTTAAAFNDKEQHSASLRLEASLRLNEAFGIRARFPLYFSLGYGYTWAWDAGLAYQLLPPGGATRQGQKYEVGLGAGLGATAFSVSYGQTDQSTATTHGTQFDLRSLIRTRTTDDIVVAHSFAWTRELSENQVEVDELEFRAAAALPTHAEGDLTTTFTLTHDLRASRTSGVAFGVKWAGDVTSSLHLSAETELQLLDPRKLWDAALDARYALGGLHALDAQVAVEARHDRPVSLTFQLGYTLPLAVPLGRRSDIGRLQGSVTDRRGHGVPGIIVTVAGQAVTTAEDGSFTFPALPTGEHLVQLIGGDALASNHILTPGAPRAITITDGGNTTLHFSLSEGATVAGALRVEGLEVIPGSAVTGTIGSPERLVRGVRIELRNGATKLQAVTDARGAFYFRQVPPGTWTLRVLDAGLPPDYRLVPDEQQLVLRAGANPDVLVRLVPVVRRIQFTEGGTLLPQGAP